MSSALWENAISTLEVRESFAVVTRPAHHVMRFFIEQMAEKPDKAISVNDRDVPLFYQRVLKKIEEYSLIEAPDIDWEDYQTEPLKASFRFESTGPEEVSMEPVLSYGDYSFHPIEDGWSPATFVGTYLGSFGSARL